MSAKLDFRDGEFWLDCFCEEEEMPEIFFVYDIVFGYPAMSVDNKAAIITHSTLALSFEGAFEWAKKFIDSRYNHGHTDNITILSIGQTGQSIDRESVMHCASGTSYIKTQPTYQRLE